jgi:hypothetical protein
MSGFLLIQTDDALLLETGDRLLLAGPVFRLTGATHLQGDATAQWLGRTRLVAGQAGIVTALIGDLARIGKVEVVLGWDESPSPDVVAYNVYRALDAPIRLAVPYRTVAGPPWTDTVFDDWTGVITYLVRALDADGNEEGNIREVLVVPVQNGVVGITLPAEPRIVEVRAISGGRIELEWLYDPAYEYLGPGAAHEARIYWDAGTGAVDFSAPHATVPMNHPTKATRYTWQSSPLTDGQTCRFTIRIATAAWPSGLETQNTDEHRATADLDAPTTPKVEVMLV